MPRHRRMAAIPLLGHSTKWERICNLEISRRRSRILRRFSRTSRIRRRNSRVIRLAGADRMRAVSYLNSSARNCNLATSLPRNRLSVPCSRSFRHRRHRRHRRIAFRLLPDRRKGSGKSEQRFLSRSRRELEGTTCRNEDERQRKPVEQTGRT